MANKSLSAQKHIVAYKQENNTYLQRIIKEYKFNEYGQE